LEAWCCLLLMYMRASLGRMGTGTVAVACKPGACVSLDCSSGCCCCCCCCCCCFSDAICLSSWSCSCCCFARRSASISCPALALKSSMSWWERGGRSGNCVCVCVCVFVCVCLFVCENNYNTRKYVPITNDVASDREMPVLTSRCRLVAAT